MRVVDNIKYEDFETVVKLTKEVEDFLFENTIDFKLSSKIPSPQYWYEKLLFPHLKDKKHKKFELIYCGIINEKPETYESKESIIERLKIKEDIVFDGSTTLIEIKPTLTSVRWIVIIKF